MNCIKRYTQTVAPTQEPVTVPDVREQCSLLGNDWDNFLADKIKEVRTVVEKRINRQLLTATWTLSLDYFPAVIELEIMPVSAVSKIEYVDLDGTTQTLSAANYQSDVVSDDQPARISPAYGLSWPDVRSDTFNAVTVTFTAGYSSVDEVPASTKQLIKLLVAHWFNHREATTTDIVNMVPAFLDWILEADNPGIYT